jgi:hypothetical protein
MKAKVKVPIPYFQEKYGNATPEIFIEDSIANMVAKRAMSKAKDMFALAACGNIAALLYTIRAKPSDNFDLTKIYYGKINGLGECVHEDEFEVMQ